ncbi:MAG: YgfZ/GcvT domain-containing protein [Parvibaculaceae bacterium]
MSLKASILPDRGVLRVGGPEARVFLQNLITNNVDLVDDTRSVYAGLLTPQGKFLFDFFINKDPSGDALLLDCDGARAGDLAKRLNFYKLRANVTIEDLSGSLKVMALWGGEVPASDRPAHLLADPRLPQMGARLISADPQIAGAEAATPAAYHAHRIALGVGDAARDFEPDRSFPLEMNFEEMHGVDFQKGCFIGQEVTSRTKRRGSVRKRLIPCEVEGEMPKPHAAVRSVGREVGTVFSVDKESGRVLALLRLDLLNGAPLEIGETTITPHKPHWAQFELTGAEEDSEEE